MAFVLSVNKSPAGQAELPRESDALKVIRIVPVKERGVPWLPGFSQVF